MNIQPQVREERTGWRDLGLSHRHRLWGWDCPAVDIDFLMVEYDRGIARALVEYKNECAPEPDWEHPSMRAIGDVASRAGIPFLVVCYATDFAWFDVWPCNTEAKRWAPEGNVTLSEPEYVNMLYRIRGRLMPSSVREQLGEASDGA